MYNLREVCNHVGTTVRSAVHIQDLALGSNYQQPHHNHASALYTPSLNPTRNALRYYPLYILPLYLQL